MENETITIKRTKEEVTSEDLAKIKELTQRIKRVKKELVELMKEKEEISSQMCELERDGYCDIEMFEDEIVEEYNTLPSFKKAAKEFEEIMQDTADFWLDYIKHRNKD